MSPPQTLSHPHLHLYLTRNQTPNATVKKSSNRMASRYQDTDSDELDAGPSKLRRPNITMSVESTSDEESSEQKSSEEESSEKESSGEESDEENAEE